MISLRHLPISRKLWLLTLLTSAGFLAVTLLALEEYHKDLMLEKKIQTQALVEIAYSIVANQYSRMENGEIDTQEAQNHAKQEISGLRYDNNANYFWINDLNAHIVMHPIKPELDGKDLSDFADPDGKKIFSEFARVAKQDGEGQVPYLWPKKGSDKPIQKVSYVKGFKPWGWVIGTGVYVDDVEAQFWSNAVVLAAAAIGILAILLGLSIAITRSIVRPLNQTTAALQDISMGEGDLTRRLDESGRDEIAKLASAFNHFTNKIQQIIIKVSQVSAQLATAAVELSSTTAQTHENITQQQTETQQVATAVTEMAATVKEIAESAEGAAGSAREADEQALKGKHVVVDVTDAITTLANEMNSASDVINLLANESESIGSVSDVIRGIAEQTSLLALNAAIEAARAGEQGRGFAVVADEVRSLASRTQQATTEIRDMIERLQSGTQNAVDVIRRSGDTTLETVEKAQAAADSLDHIVSSVALISDRNTQIASASEEQSAVALEIDRSVVQISQLTDHSALASEQITQATAELSELGESLQEMISHFKTA
ncbi:MAG: methyl-accepting chemotaxis protein [Candidatus Thiodiazotropha sp.]